MQVRYHTGKLSNKEMDEEDIMNRIVRQAHGQPEPVDTEDDDGDDEEDEEEKEEGKTNAADVVM